MKYDICCLGSALVDLTFKIDDDFTKKNEKRGIVKGGMTLIEKNDQNDLIQELKGTGKFPEEACGGSATNSIVAAALFGSDCYMSCIVANDDNGKFYLEDLSTNGVKHSSELNPSQIPSGQCLVMISSDAERTMCTNLGINSEISSKNVNEEVIKNSNYLLLEGYLIASPGGYEAFKKAVELAKEHNTKVALSLSDTFIVNSFGKELRELIEIKCDLIFCNETEAMEFSGKNTDEEIFVYFKDYTSNLLMTKGPGGCSGYEQDNEFTIPGIEVEAIDTNGAGDMFAGAVLNNLNDSKSLEESAKFGCYAASKTVQNSGPRLSKEGYKEIKEIFSSI
jgi:sugar/nucleoside kinase (ribokinase family)